MLIPCFNESKTITKVITDFKAILPEADVYVYDNNSSDYTDKIAKAAGAIVRYEHRQGKGNVIRTMFREIDADCYIMADGDDTYPAEFAKEMADEVLKNKVDMVIGDRLSSTYFVENKRPFHNSGNVIVRKLVNLLFHGNITDIMTGYRAFSPQFVKSFPVLSKGFEIETEMTIHSLDKNFLIKSVPVTYRDRPQGSESKLNTYNDGLKVISTIFCLYKDYKPLAFFTVISAVLLFLSVVLLVPIVLEYMNTGMVPKIPTLIVSAFCALAAVQSMTCGLILDTETKKAKQNFEIQLNLIEMEQHKFRSKEEAEEKNPTKN